VFMPRQSKLRRVPCPTAGRRSQGQARSITIRSVCLFSLYGRTGKSNPICHVRSGDCRRRRAFRSRQISAAAAAAAAAAAQQRSAVHSFSLLNLLRRSFISPPWSCVFPGSVEGLWGRRVAEVLKGRYGFLDVRSSFCDVVCQCRGRVIRPPSRLRSLQCQASWYRCVHGGRITGQR